MRTRAVHCVFFLSNSWAIGCKKTPCGPSRSARHSRARVMQRVPRSLGDRRDDGCKASATVHFSPAFCPIATAMLLQTRQKLSSPGSLFASTPSAAQTPGLPDLLGGCGREPVRLAFKSGGGACLVQIEIDQSTSATHRSLAPRVFTYLHTNASLPPCVIMHTHAKL